MVPTPPALMAGLILLFLCFATVAAGSNDSAWNGHTLPGSTKPSQFTPYYVPPGTKSYDSANPLIHYTGKWTDSFSPSYVHQSVRSCSEPSCAMSFAFTGTGIEWFGNCDDTHGVSAVYLDGKLVDNVDAYCVHASPQQRMFSEYSLPYKKHTIKIINTAKRPGSTKATIMSVDALVVTKGLDPKISPPVQQETTAPPMNVALVQAAQPDKWTLTQQGSTGVHAMQLAIISDTHALIVDKVEHNPLTISGHPAWSALYNLKTNAVTPLAIQSNSFCAGGTFLGNGTIVNVGGNPVVDGFTSSADFGDLDGLQAVRLFHPCDSESANDCEMYENHDRIRMASPRWYNTVTRIADGSAMIVGGSKKGGWINNATTNNPTIEYYPPKSLHGHNGLPIPLPFLQDTLNSNLFPHVIPLPDGRIFIAANRDAMIYNWLDNTEQRLPQLPNGVRVTYPMTGTALLLPLSPEDNYKPEVLICGGSTVDDKKAGYDISSQDPASSQCSRMVLTDAGIAAGWQVEQMPQARTMPDAVLLPTGNVVIVNGAGSGISGYGNVRNQVGASNAANPVLTPLLYKPEAAEGQRFSSEGMPKSDIPRLYHSVATLTPAGSVMIAGSNPNLDRSEIEYGTEYRVEWLSPPYMAAARPSIEGKTLKQLDFGQQAQITVTMPESHVDVKVVLMDLGYVTHAVHANTRLVYLVSTVQGDGKTVSITGPPNGNIYPPGPAFIYVVVNGVPSEGIKIMVGDGKGPAVDQGAIDNLLANSDVDQYEKSKKKGGKDDSE